MVLVLPRCASGSGGGGCGGEAVGILMMSRSCSSGTGIGAACGALLWWRPAAASSSTIASVPTLGHGRREPGLYDYGCVCVHREQEVSKVVLYHGDFLGEEGGEGGGKRERPR